MKAFATKMRTIGLSIGLLGGLSGAFVKTAMVLAFTLATALAAQVKIPVPGTPIPVTLQTAIVLLAGLSLGRTRGALSQALYIAAGALGLPFFAGASGMEALVGPSGGYLFGFILAAWFAGSIPTRGSFLRTWLITFVASLLIFIPGVLQLKALTLATWPQAFAMGVLPFIFGDLMKVTLVATIHSLRTTQPRVGSLE